MKFKAKGRTYEVDRFGVIHQTDARPFIYDRNYVTVYDTDSYRRHSDILQAMRLGFVLAGHGKPVSSLLDYGYGNGAFMMFARRHVPCVYGFDITGLPVPGCYIVPQIIQADVITFWDALEHVPDLSILKDLPAETVVISLPWCHFLTQGSGWFENYHHLKPDEHLHHFNDLSLSNLMNHFGWKEIARSSHEDVIRRSRHGLPNILTMAFKRK